MVAHVESYVRMRWRMTVGMAISRPLYARCARPCVDPFLTCLERYLLNGSNRFVHRWRVIADVTLVQSTLKLGRKTVSEHRLVIYQSNQKDFFYKT